jgi:hypothetical protein
VFRRKCFLHREGRRKCCRGYLVQAHGRESDGLQCAVMHLRVRKRRETSCLPERLLGLNTERLNATQFSATVNMPDKIHSNLYGSQAASVKIHQIIDDF